MEEPLSNYYSSDYHSTDSGEELVFKLVEPSPSSDPHEQGGLPSNKHVTIAHLKMLQSPYRFRSSHLSCQILYISDHR